MSAPFVDFGGRRVLVTGASSGIGRAIATELAQRGAALVLLGRDRPALNATREGLEGSDHHVVELDLADADRVGPALRQLTGDLGRLYGLCHSAGVVQTLPLAANRPTDTRAMMEVNLVAALELARAVTRRDVMEPDGGAIVFVASVYGRVGIAGQIGYSASKGALIAAARSMALELARRNIRVNTVSPGMVATPMTDGALALLTEEQLQRLRAGYPLGIGHPSDVARTAVFLLAPQTRWITGTDVVVDGGYTAA